MLELDETKIDFIYIVLNIFAFERCIVENTVFPRRKREFIIEKFKSHSEKSIEMLF
jgi:hypothetical protein